MIEWKINTWNKEVINKWENDCIKHWSNKRKTKWVMMKRVKEWKNPASEKLQKWTMEKNSEKHKKVSHWRKEVKGWLRETKCARIKEGLKECKSNWKTDWIKQQVTERHGRGKKQWLMGWRSEKWEYFTFPVLIIDINDQYLISRQWEPWKRR